VLPVEHSVLWYDAIQMKRSVCHAIGVLLVLVVSVAAAVFFSLDFFSVLSGV